MKRIITTLTMLTFVFYGFAQYYQLPLTSDPGNPGGLNTQNDQDCFSDATWTEIIASSQTSDVYSTTQTIPFTFNFNGAAVTQFKASSTGYITFDITATVSASSTNTALPAASLPDKSICVWGMECSGANDAVMTATFGTTPNRQHWILFRSMTTPGATGPWTYYAIVLAETSDDIYLVDLFYGTNTSYTSPELTLGIQVDAFTAYEVSGSPNIVSANPSDEPTDNDYWQFIYGTQPNYDFSAEAFDIAGTLLLSNAPFAITGTLLNRGATTITDFVMNYSIDGGTAVTQNVTGVSIASATTYDFTHATSWTPSATGSYNVEVWASDLNSNVDEDLTNDRKDSDVSVIDQATTKIVLYEVFTSSTCAPCKPGNENLKALFGLDPAAGTNANTWVMLKNQMSWPGSGDPYYTDEGNARRSFYGFSGVPWLYIDGGYDANVNSLIQSEITTAAAEMAFIDLSATYTVDTATQTVVVDVTIDPIADFASTNMVLQIAVLEEETFNNVKSNGETSFNFVMKKYLPDASGTSVGPFTNGTQVTHHESYTFKGSYILPPDANSPVNHAVEHSIEEMDDLLVVAFIQDNTTKAVHQATWATKGTSGINSIDASSNSLVALYPNPADELAAVRYHLTQSANVSFSLYNLLGETVYTKNEGTLASGEYTSGINVKDLPSGIYMFKLMVGEQMFVERITIK